MAIDFRVTGEQLIGIPIFSNLNPFEAMTLMEITSIRAFSEGQAIFEEGTPGDSLFVILKGRVDILKDLGGSEKKVIAQFGAGTAFGEMTLIADSVAERTASALATERTRVLIIHKDDFQKLVNFGSLIAYKVAFNISKLLSERLTRVDQALLEFYNDSDGQTQKTLEIFIERRRKILDTVSSKESAGK
jgi:PPM family protein phosphatase